MRRGEVTESGAEARRIREKEGKGSKEPRRIEAERSEEGQKR